MRRGRRTRARVRRLAALAALSVAAGMGACAKRDVDGMCKLAKEILAEPHTAPEARYDSFKRQVPRFVYTSEGEAVVAALDALPPAARYARLLDFAQRTRGADWTCPALASVLDLGAVTTPVAPAPPSPSR